MTVSRWVKKNQDDNSRPRKPRPKANLIADCIREMIASDPFTSNVKIVNKLRDVLRVNVSKELVRTAIQKSGYTKKKARFHGVPGTLPQVVVEFVEKRSSLLQQGRQFVSIDETSFGRHGRATYGYSPKGTPLFVKKGNGPRMTTKSALVCASNDGIYKSHVKVGAFKAADFVDALSNFKLPQHSVLLLDNASIHKTKLVKEFAKANDFEILYTPPYSPWFNPIEGIFSIVKRNFYAFNDIDNALRSPSDDHIQAFFKKSFALESAPHPFHDMGKSLNA